MAVLRRFEFEPQFLLMSGVIAREELGRNQNVEAQVLLKGSPHELMPLVDCDRLPQTWNKVTHHIFYMSYSSS